MVSMSRGRIELQVSTYPGWLNSPEVDDLGLDALLSLELLSGLETEADGLRVGDEGDVSTLALDLGLAEGEEEVVLELLLGHGEGDTVHELVLKEADLAILIF